MIASIASARIVIWPETAAPLRSRWRVTTPTSPVRSPRKRKPASAADLLHLSGHAINDVAYAAVRKHFSEQEIIELTAVAGAFEFFTRMNTALRIPVTPLPPER